MTIACGFEKRNSIEAEIEIEPARDIDSLCQGYVHMSMHVPDLHDVTCLQQDVLVRL